MNSPPTPAPDATPLLQRNPGDPWEGVNHRGLLETLEAAQEMVRPPLSIGLPKAHRYPVVIQRFTCSFRIAH
jgi:hypothetical protein